MRLSPPSIYGPCMQSTLRIWCGFCEPTAGPNNEFAGGRQERSRQDWCSVAAHVNLDDLPQDWESSQAREVMLVTVQLPNAGFQTTIEKLRLHSWLLGPGQPTEVIDCFPEANGDFNLIVDDRADTHISSADGRLYLGWVSRRTARSRGGGLGARRHRDRQGARLPCRLRPPDPCTARGRHRFRGARHRSPAVAPTPSCGGRDPRLPSDGGSSSPRGLLPQAARCTSASPRAI